MGVVGMDLQGAPMALFALVVVIVVSHSAGWVAARCGQPRVIGELIGGIALGPSALGALVPDLAERLFTPEVLDGLQTLAQLGLVLFMFLVGAELRIGDLGEQRRQMFAVSFAGMVIPFLGGLGLSVWLHERFEIQVGRLGFAMFMGVAMAITAFPVLARIIADRGLAHTALGTLVLGSAAIDDVTAWCLLAVVTAIVSSGDAGDVVTTIVGAVAVASVLLGLVRPLLRRTGVNVAGALCLAILSATATELVGVHSVFGAFIAGAILPRDAGLVERLESRIEPLTMSGLLPAFFVGVGIATDIGSLNAPWLWGAAAVVIAVATVGKFLGATTAARWTGSTWSDAWTIGALMNTRGLTEIVVLTVGRELGVIDGRLFTVMVLMALVTTVMAGPVLSLFDRWFGGAGPPPLSSSGPSGHLDLDSR